MKEVDASTTKHSNNYIVVNLATFFSI